MLSVIMLYLFYKYLGVDMAGTKNAIAYDVTVIKGFNEQTPVFTILTFCKIC
jgi:hypothetical protein